MLVHVESSMSNQDILTTWKFIDIHVNPSLATNGNEQFVWVVFRGEMKCNHRKRPTLPEKKMLQ